MRSATNAEEERFGRQLGEELVKAPISARINIRKVINKIPEKMNPDNVNFVGSSRPVEKRIISIKRILGAKSSKRSKLRHENGLSKLNATIIVTIMLNQNIPPWLISKRANHSEIALMKRVLRKAFDTEFRSFAVSFLKSGIKPLSITLYFLVKA
ncbi:hypothetical protein KFU94_06460 [Chloroflexi bacterium TSY]|nr:hypothetical protein [Chloroflexi bacterium TSY]